MASLRPMVVGSERALETAAAASDLLGELELQ